MKYSLSARLRQCFDFLVMKVYASVYSTESTFFLNDQLRKIGTSLLQNINSIIFDKL